MIKYVIEEQILSHIRHDVKAPADQYDVAMSLCLLQSMLDSVRYRSIIYRLPEGEALMLEGLKELVDILDSLTHLV